MLAHRQIESLAQQTLSEEPIVTFEKGKQRLYQAQQNAQQEQ